MEKISPRVDIAFKKIFGVEENKDLLISLINSIVSPADRVADVTLLNPYNPKNFRDDKLSILDIKAKGETGKRFNIEIQISDEADYDKRALYYWAKLYTEQLQTSKDYSTLSKAIGIHILNFTSIFGVSKYHNVFHITEKETGSLYFKDLELHTIELNKFSENLPDDLKALVDRVKNALDIWAAFLTRHDLMNVDNLPIELDNPELKKAIHVLEVMNFKPEERELYEGHLKWLMIEENTLKKYRSEGREEGEMIGLEKGERIGLEKGRQEGEQKMREEKKNMARKMLEKGMDTQTVSELTGLSIKDIQSLT